MATEQNDYAIVSITKTVSVYPKFPRPLTLLNLSNLDRQCPALMYLVFFYNPSHHQTMSLESLFSNLEVGLEETLSVWYPAAGRLTVNPNDSKLDVLCNNAGAILVEAVTQGKISELGDLSQYNDFYENLVSKPTLASNFAEVPLVIGQVTKFACGGYTIGIGTSHSLFDGRSMFDFLTAWAGKTAKRGGGGAELHQPVHERGRLLLGVGRPQHLITRLCNKSLNPVTRVSAIDHLHQLIKQAGSDQSLDMAQKLGRCQIPEMGCSNQENHILRTFHLSTASIESLKRKIYGINNPIHSCSSFEVVAAFLWKARTKSLELWKERMVCLQFAVDTRNKTATPLSRGFSGNAYVLASISCTAGELEEQNYEVIVEKIKEAKNSVKDDYLSAYLEALDGPQATLPPLKELTLISDWTRTPFHKVDFGHGEAIYASPLAPPLPQVAYFMQSPNETGSIDVRIGLLTQHLDAFTHHFPPKLQ